MATTSPREPQQARSILTRERLLDAAVECLVEDGYAGTTTVSACERANLSRGAHLHHFATKDDLLLAALEHLAHRRFEGIAAQAAKLAQRTRPIEFVDRVRDGVELTWSTFAEGPFFGALELWVAARTDPALQTEVHRVERALGADVAALFDDMFPREITDTAAGKYALRDVTYMLRGLALTRLIRANKKDEERVLNRCTEMLLEVARSSVDTSAGAATELTTAQVTGK